MLNQHLLIARYSRPSMGGACETSPRTRDDSEHHQIKNSKKCSLYGGTMPLNQKWYSSYSTKYGLRKQTKCGIVQTKPNTVYTFEPKLA